MRDIKLPFRSPHQSTYKLTILNICSTSLPASSSWFTTSVGDIGTRVRPQKIQGLSLHDVVINAGKYALHPQRSLVIRLSNLTSVKEPVLEAACWISATLVGIRFVICVLHHRTCAPFKIISEAETDLHQSPTNSPEFFIQSNTFIIPCCGQQVHDFKLILRILSVKEFVAERYCSFGEGYSVPGNFNTPINRNDICISTGYDFVSDLRDDMVLKAGKRSIKSLAAIKNQPAHEVSNRYQGSRIVNESKVDSANFLTSIFSSRAAESNPRAVSVSDIVGQSRMQSRQCPCHC